MELKLGQPTADPAAKAGNQAKGPTINSKSTPADPLDQGYLLFNVMPKVDSAPESLTEPTIKITEPAEAPTATPSSRTAGNLLKFWDTYRLYIILGLAGLVLVGVALIGYSMYTDKQASDASTKLLQTSTHTPQPQPIPLGSASSTIPELADRKWQKNYFGNELCQDQATCGPDADPDHDGLSNADEYKLGTDPNNPDSDGDGISDGDEVHVFATNPLSAHSGKDPKYVDSDYLKGGYSLQTDQKFTDGEMAQLTANMKQYGLHAPTIQTLKDSLISLYKFTNWSTTNTSTSTASSTAPAMSTTTALSGIDTSINAQQDRDARRSDTINNVGVALVKFYADNRSYPTTNDFQDMFSQVKMYIKVATNPVDPVNKDPYIYTYSVSPSSTDFTLSFYSEVAGQIIKKHAADAQKILSQQQADNYDQQRKTDLESLQTALLLYSSKNTAGGQDYVFPTVDKYKADLAPAYIAQIPKDPKTGQDYLYQVSNTFDSFTLKATLDNPPAGTTGYLCNETECKNY